MNKNSKPLFFILYDGIANSVFINQVISPLIKKADKKKIILVSFESKSNNKTLKKRLPKHKNLHYIITERSRFWGICSLQKSIKFLQKLLALYNCYELTARGPLAGYICLHAYTLPACTQLVIQIRGLLAEEYAYTHQTNNLFLRFFYAIRTYQYKKLENTVYTKKQSYNILLFEAVSYAMKKYIAEKYSIQKKKIIVAYNDIPSFFDKKTVDKWRQKARTSLKISYNNYVYCYNGSAKKWQCPQTIISFFKKKHQKNKQSYLLILTQDTKTFENYINKKLPKESYTITSVPHSKLYFYLSAADIGIVFREKQILNWVSRPTKILDYRAVHLPIIHNNTIEYLTKKTYKKEIKRSF
jgi:hypothetical protein